MNGLSTLLDKKTLRRRYRKFRDRLMTRLFDTRFGRDLLIRSIGPRAIAISIDCGDHVMTVSPADYIGRKVFRKGHFERERVTQLIDILRNEGLLTSTATTLLEIGGNIGTQTLYFALNGVFDRIVTVEPDPRNYRLLLRNIVDNKFSHVIHAVNCAAGDRDGDIDFFLHLNNHGKSSAVRQSTTDQHICVPVRTVPAIISEAGLNEEDIGLIWMDIEGYEPVACRSMTHLLSRQTPLYLEFTPQFYGKAGAEEFIGFLSGFFSECLIFREDQTERCAVKDIPTEGDQFDVLLMR